MKIDSVGVALWVNAGLLMDMAEKGIEDPAQIEALCLNLINYLQMIIRRVE